MASLRPPRPLDGDVNIGYQLEVGATATFVGAAIAVVFRCFARFKYAQLGWDDWTMVFALVQALIATVLDFVATHWGLGRHLFFLTKQQAINMQYWQLLSQVFCVNALTFAKISICFSYLRVLRGSQNKALKWLLYLTGFLVFAVNTVVIISFYVSCNPPKKSYNPFIPGKCWDKNAVIGLILLQGSFSALTDFFLAAFPFVLFKDLKVGRKSKGILLALMSLGVVTGVFALIRTVEGGKSLKSKGIRDQSYASVSGLMWAGMERNIAIMIASIPPIRPLAAPFVKLASQTFSTGRFSGRTTQGNTTEGSGYEMGKSNKFKKIGVTNDSKPSYVQNTVTRSSGPGQSTGSEERILPMDGSHHV